MSCTQCKLSALENDEDDWTHCKLEIGYLYHLKKFFNVSQIIASYLTTVNSFMVGSKIVFRECYHT